MSSSAFRITKTAATATTTAIAAATTATIAATTTTTTTTAAAATMGTGKRKRSVAGRDKRWARPQAQRAMECAMARDEEVKKLKEALAASQREAAVERAAAQRSEQKRQWAVEAGSDDFIARMHMESKLNETEDLALFALEAYERADKQRTELYYQAKSSNSLAAKTLMESLNGGGGETCKALAKQRKVQVVAQAKELRLTVKPHLAAAAKAVQGHKPFARPSK